MYLRYYVSKTFYRIRCLFSTLIKLENNRYFFLRIKADFPTGNKIKKEIEILEKHFLIHRFTTVFDVGGMKQASLKSEHSKEQFNIFLKTNSKIIKENVKKKLIFW